MRSAFILLWFAIAAGCAVGPDYRRPAVPAPAAFKEAEGWKPAAPAETIERGAWWKVFHDPVLDELAPQVATSNFSLAQSAANYEQARQLARADRATLFPALTGTLAAQRSKAAASGRATPSGTVNTNYSASLGASWTPDFWGRVRRLDETDLAAAQASAANLAAARLSLESQLARTYFQLRIADERIRLRQGAVDAYTRTLQIAQNKYGAGVVARSDVISAQALLDAARAQSIDAGITRAQLEHALAVLIGKAPAEFSLAPQPALVVVVPAIPPGVPSALLERRPDIALAERNVAAANARVGVQTAGFFPQLTLSATGGYESTMLSQLFRAPNRFWSLGADLGETIFDFGKREANRAATRAAYDASVAGYRAAVLQAFQEIEDDLTALRLLESEAQVQDTAVNEAAEAARIAMNEYRAGTVDYTTVAAAQVSELNNRQTALAVLANRLATAVGFIEALGGGWQQADLPNADRILHGDTAH